MASNDNDEDPARPSSLEPETGLDEVWSTIGPGGHGPADDPPPTPRPYDPSSEDQAAWIHHRDLHQPGAEPMPMSEASPDPIQQSPKIRESSEPADQLRDELRLGVRMIEALENQMKKAEHLIQLEEQASRDLMDRISSVDSIDTRLEEIEATISTVERRLERQAPGNRESRPRSGSLSIDGVQEAENRSPEPTGSTSPDRVLLESAKSVRSDLRRELEAICQATASLAEVVEQANRTERILRSTLETVSGVRSDSGSPAWTVSSILRRLAEEFDVQSVKADDPPVKQDITDTPPLIVEIDATNDLVSPPPSEKSIGSFGD